MGEKDVSATEYLCLNWPRPSGFKILTEAHGTTVTEFGLVPVSWTQASHQIRFTFTVPPGVQAVLRLPLKPAQTVNIDGRAWPAEVKGTRLEVRVPPRSHERWY